MIFDFIDGELPKKYSSKKKLKGIAMCLAEMEKLDCQNTEKLLVEVDHLKSIGTLSYGEILAEALRILRPNDEL